MQIPWGGGGGQKFRQNPSVSHGFRDKCIFLHFMQKFMMATKNDRKMLFGKNAFLNHLIVQIPSGVKNFAEITLSHTVSEINVFLHSTQKFKMANKDGGKMTYGKNCHVTLQIPRGGGGGGGSKISLKSLYLTSFPRKMHLLHFMQKFKMATKIGRKTILQKNHQFTL